MSDPKGERKGDDDDDDEIIDAEPGDDASSSASSRPASSSQPALGYRSGIDDRNETRDTVNAGKALLAFLGAGGAIFASGVFAAIASDLKRGGLIGVIVACVALGAVAYGIRRDPKHQAWYLGIIIAIGVVGLLDGLCFIAWK